MDFVNAFAESIYPTHVWTVIGLAGLIASTALFLLTVKRLVQLNRDHENGATGLVVWGLLMSSLAFLLLFGVTFGIGIAAIDEFRPWSARTVVALFFEIAVALFAIGFVGLLYLARRVKVVKKED